MTWPNKTPISEDIIFSAIFCAEPAPKRVEPAITSGGVGKRTGTSEPVINNVSSLLDMPIVVAPRALAIFMIVTG